MKETTPHSLALCFKLGSDAPDAEVAELFPPFREEDGQPKVRDDCVHPKPFAAFGSFRQMHGDVVERNCMNCMRTIETLAKFESAGCSRTGGLSHAFSHQEGEGNDRSMTSSDRLAISQTVKPLSRHGKAPYKGKSFSTDLDREEAWERKKEQYLLDGSDCDDGDEYSADEGAYDGEEESAAENDDSDILRRDAKDSVNQNLEHGEGSWDVHGVLLDEVHVDEEPLYDQGMKKASRRMPISRKKLSRTRRYVKPVMRIQTKSLTDEDMEELRGSIDLGFGFSYSERSNLKSTLPALELYYAINKNYVDAQNRASPVSTLDGSVLARTNSADSNGLSPSREAWRISSPGDHPTQVKTRLRHWAQAVACYVKQGC